MGSVVLFDFYKPISEFKVHVINKTTVGLIYEVITSTYVKTIDILKALFQLLVQTVTSDPEARLTRVAKVEVVLVVLVWRVVPLLRICLIVVLHQRAKEDDEDDLQDETGDRQLQTHVGCGVHHVALLVVRWGAEVDLTFQQRSSVSPGVEGGRLQGERGRKMKFTERPASCLFSVLLSHWVTPTGPVSWIMQLQNSPAPWPFSTHRWNYLAIITINKH